jgi:SPP1 family predicted phage head-tail adaptor
MIRAGDLREQVTIQTATETPNDSGGGAIDWPDSGVGTTVWANVAPVRGNEQLQAQRVDAVVLYRVTTRFRTDVTAANRLTWRGTPLNIRAVTDPDGMRQWLEIMCEAGVQ